MTCGKKIREKCKKYWKSQGISEEEKSGNPVNGFTFVHQGCYDIEKKKKKNLRFVANLEFENTSVNIQGFKSSTFSYTLTAPT